MTPSRVCVLMRTKNGKLKGKSVHGSKPRAKVLLSCDWHGCSGVLLIPGVIFHTRNLRLQDHEEEAKKALKPFLYCCPKPALLPSFLPQPSVTRESQGQSGLSLPL